MSGAARSLGAIALGVITAMLVIVAGDTLAHAFYPLPAGIDYRDKPAMSAAIGNLPSGAFAIVLLGWALGSFLGGFVAAKMADRRRLFHALIVGVILLAAGIANLVQVPHPPWMWVAGIIVFPLGAYLAGRMTDSARVAA
jgi:hypothetical protein